MRALAKVPEVAFAIIAFHAQQSVEKSLKAVMAVGGITFPRTHSLEELYCLLVEAGYAVPISVDLLMNLTPYAVSTRYDIDSQNLIDGNQAEIAVSLALEWATLHLEQVKK